MAIADVTDLADTFEKTSDSFELDRRFKILLNNKERAFKNLTQMKHILIEQVRNIEDTYKPSKNLQDIHKNIRTLLQMLAWADRAMENNRRGEYLGAIDAAKSVFSELQGKVIKFN